MGGEERTQGSECVGRVRLGQRPCWWAAAGGGRWCLVLSPVETQRVRAGDPAGGRSPEVRKTTWRGLWGGLAAEARTPRLDDRLVLSFSRRECLEPAVATSKGSQGRPSAGFLVWLNNLEVIAGRRQLIGILFGLSILCPITRNQKAFRTSRPLCIHPSFPTSAGSLIVLGLRVLVWKTELTTHLPLGWRGIYRVH